MSTSILKIFKLGFPWQTKDPFLFCVYHLDFFPKGNSELGPNASLEGRNLGNDFTIKDGWRMYHGQTIPGFPVHPHCGFETVTMVNKGFCDHSDSLGAAGRFGEGDVQWMTAGSGVQHSEMFPLLNTEKENTMELFQIWLNLPKTGKFANPHFKMIWHEDIPIIEKEDAAIKIVTGDFENEKGPDPAPDSWAFDKTNEVAIWNIKITSNGTLTLPKASQPLNRTLYFYEGDSALIDNQEVFPDHGIELNSESEVSIHVKGKSAKFLLLQGRPIDEPVAKYGPFVMNTDDEIQKVMQTYRLTQFGGWPWPYPDNVHPSEKGRFAKYPDGTVVEK